MSILEYLQKHMPLEKAQLILGFLSEHKCVLKITKPRKTKRGDFRQQGNKLSISINHDDNSYRFLFTLIHEIAHLKTFHTYRNRVQPHGVEWKTNFRLLFYFFKIEELFEKDTAILHTVQKELLNPKACSGVNVEIEKVFGIYDTQTGTYLEEITDGTTFIFRNHQYQKLESKRSRVVCLNLANHKKYTINKAALVTIIVD